MKSSRILFASLLVLPIVGCATILDFQDATEMPLTVAQDPSAPGTSSSSSSSSSSSGSGEGGIAQSEASSSSGEDAQQQQQPNPPSCACVVTPPEGWTGPVALYEGAPEIAPPACGGRYSEAIYTGSKDPVAPDATCGCSCGAPTGVTCGTPRVTYYRDKFCTTTCSGSTTLSAGSCVRNGPGFSNCDDSDVRAFTIGASEATGGSCVANATKTVQPAQFGSVARLCGLPTDGDGGVTTEAAEKAACGGGTICAPLADSPFAATNHCVVRTGSWMCPAGYPIKRTLYDGTKGTDTRSCSACSCGSPTGDCSVDLEAYTGTTCTGAPSVTSAPAACSTFTQSTRFIPGAPQVAATCAPSGGTPVGSFVPADPTTVCCEQ
jgi:hypothetical protein